MEKNIIIVGKEHLGKTLHDLKHHNLNDAIVIISQETNQLAFPQSEPFLLCNPYPIESMTGDFVCKGKHQYKKVDKNNLVEWICQCGRKTTD